MSVELCIWKWGSRFFRWQIFTAAKGQGEYLPAKESRTPFPNTATRQSYINLFIPQFQGKTNASRELFTYAYS